MRRVVSDVYYLRSLLNTPQCLSLGFRVSSCAVSPCLSRRPLCILSRMFFSFLSYHIPFFPLICPLRVICVYCR
ncbi:hypothetical protein BV25DRAFT_1173325 [Artomyces pyxidatus]|uniref:Uncharacterized protein n=1 Tax=Artomyces pyxidatus TaxID=48021 RepID=A0ACB8SRT8_9AGAM|nr:hypothetical protein BV25DRAFT_1173325 [Artomyces pyxidatus]